MIIVDLGKLIKCGEYFDRKIATDKNAKDIVVALNKEINSSVETYDHEKK